MKKIACIILIMTVGFVSNSQLLPVRNNFLWGFANEKGEYVVAPKYGAVEPFDSEGHAIVMQDGLLGLIDVKGQEVLASNYITIEHLFGDLYVVESKDGKRLYKVSTQQLNRHVFDNVEIERNIIIASKDEVKTVYDTTGNLISSNVVGEVYFYSNHLFVHDQKSLSIYKEGNLITKLYADAVDFYGSSYFGVTRSGYISLHHMDQGQLFPYELTDVNISFVKGTLALQIKVNGLYGLWNKDINILPCSINPITPNGDFYQVYRKMSIGLVTSKGIELVPFGFDKIFEISSDGLMAYRVDSLWGLADVSKGVLSGPIYSIIGQFKGNYTVVKRGKYYGLLNKEGKEVISAKYNNCELSSQSMKFYAKDYTLFVSLNEKQLIEDQKIVKNLMTIKMSQNREAYDIELPTNEIRVKGPKVRTWGRGGMVMNATDGKNDFEMYRKGKYLVGAKINGRLLTNPSYWRIHIEDFEKGDVARAIYDGGRHCLITKKGKVIFQQFYSRYGKQIASPIHFVGEFSEDGLAPIYLGGYMYNNDRKYQKFREYNFYSAPLHKGVWGFINRKGVMVIEAAYNDVYLPKHGRALVKNRNGWGVVDLKGRTVIPCQYGRVQYMYNNDDKEVTFYVTDYKNCYGYIDNQGHELSEVRFLSLGYFKEGKAPVRISDGWTYVNGDGDQVTSVLYQRAQSFYEGLAAVRVNNLWGFINHDFEWVIEPQYKEAGHFSQGMAPVKIGEKYGYINASNDWVIKPNFDKALSFYKNYAGVKKGDHWKIINVEGKVAIPGSYKKIVLTDFGNKLYPNYGGSILLTSSGEKQGNKGAWVKQYKGNTYLTVFHNGEILKYNKNQELLSFQNSLEEYEVVKTKLNENGVVTKYYHYEDNKGDIAFNKVFHYANYFDNNMAVVGRKYDGQIELGLMNKQGVNVTEYYYDGIKNQSDEYYEVKKNRFYGMYNINGLKLLDASYESIQPYDNGLYQVRTGGKVGYIDALGEWKIALNK